MNEIFSEIQSEQQFTRELTRSQLQADMPGFADPGKDVVLQKILEARQRLDDLENKAKEARMEKEYLENYLAEQIKAEGKKSEKIGGYTVIVAKRTFVKVKDDDKAIMWADAHGYQNYSTKPTVTWGEWKDVIFEEAAEGRLLPADLFEICLKPILTIRNGKEK